MMNETYTYRKCLEFGKQILADAGIWEADNDAWLLLESVFQITRTEYYMKSDQVPEEDLIRDYEKKIQRRANREPLQYIEGMTWFMGYTFKVTPDVLIPRLDTEVLVCEALKYINRDSKVLDMCTGSGCIAVSIAAESKAENICAVDLSEAALQIAIENGKKNQVDYIEFIQSDMFENVKGKFDCIISNPPYIKTSEIPDLMYEVGKCEPRMALDGHKNGLYFYEILVKNSVEHLLPNGMLIMEIGCDQGEEVKCLLENHQYINIKIIKDLAGMDRVVCGWRE